MARLFLFCANRWAQKNPAGAGSFKTDSAQGLEAEAAEALVELGNAAAAVHELLVAAGPGRVRLRIDFKVHGGAFRTPGRAGFVLGAVGHDDLDRVVLRMDVSLHVDNPALRGPYVAIAIADPLQ
ncbi:protein of unknown function [Pseudorhizobium banfieldiae]|uniref:Uncharacterized protein n=1 Tax=Pseudorhizobium banfieldiae TaxID=1125847 RepID=L0NH32_9HYPH|nr:protein of unknown function [Pseudorhizobium banfieldiae]